MGQHVIVGAGTVGSALAARLAEGGRDVIVVSRRGTAPPAEGVRGVAADASDAAALAVIAAGADAIYNCANPQYHRWERDWPPIAASILGAAERSGAVLATLSNLYGYGPVDGAMTETLPLAATSSKGQVRATMWRDALAAHEAGRVRATEVRASDYFGPGVRDTGMLGERVVPRVLDHRTISVLGNPDAPRSWTFVPDVVSALEVVASHPAAWGRPWHVPTAAPMSTRGAVCRLADVAGLDAPAVRRLPWSLVRIAGLFSPEIHELPEIAYQFDRPFVVDSSAFTAAFGVEATPLDQSLGETIEWWRRQRGFPLPVLATSAVG